MSEALGWTGNTRKKLFGTLQAERRVPVPDPQHPGEITKLVWVTINEPMLQQMLNEISALQRTVNAIDRRSPRQLEAQVRRVIAEERKPGGALSFLDSNSYFVDGAPKMRSLEDDEIANVVRHSGQLGRTDQLMDLCINMTSQAPAPAKTADQILKYIRDAQAMFDALRPVEPTGLPLKGENMFTDQALEDMNRLTIEDIPRPWPVRFGGLRPETHSAFQFYDGPLNEPGATIHINGCAPVTKPPRKD